MGLGRGRGGLEDEREGVRRPLLIEERKKIFSGKRIQR